jgi:GT2 family glycosyltransferase/glycosyltransferase involved in cell wall biosynthesis
VTNGLSHCDIVIPIFNGLTYVSDCIDSIFEFTDMRRVHLYIIDDGSDRYTAQYLEKLASKHPEITLQRNSANLGFVKSCNTGISLGRAPWVLLLNSDVVVSPGWLARLLECAESDPCIGSVNPLTNHASNINIPIVPGANFLSMDAFLREHSPCHYPDVVTGVGFCLLLRRAALRQVGLFDEIFERGYCEESDLCMRLTTNGYRTVVADNVFVFHKGRATFGDRRERYERNRKIFDKRWNGEYKRQFRSFLSANPLKPVRNLFRLEQRWDPEPSMRETYRRMRDQFRRHRYLKVLREALRGLRRLPYAGRDMVTPAAVARFTRSNRLRVTYVLHHLTVAGGVLSVVQLVNELILLGVEARIVALVDYPEIYNWKYYTRPIVFRSVSELRANFPESDIAVATHWTTAPWVADLVKAGRSREAVYFLQDYECWFFPEADQASRAQVKKTYDLIPNKIVKSEWLQDILAKDGYASQKVPLGMDLALFYPRDIATASRPTILAMARPRTPRRGFPFVIEALRRVHAALPEVEIVLFGDDLSSQNIPFPHRDEGVITDRNQIALLYSRAHVFLDGSNFQGFGRTALEAMACGTACVLTNVGGVSEYASDGKNCLLVPPQEPKAFADGIIRIFKDDRLRRKLVQGGLETVQNYSLKREAKATLELLQRYDYRNRR